MDFTRGSVPAAIMLGLASMTIQATLHGGLSAQVRPESSFDQRLRTVQPGSLLPGRTALPLYPQTYAIAPEKDTFGETVGTTIEGLGTIARSPHYSALFPSHFTTYTAPSPGADVVPDFRDAAGGTLVVVGFVGLLGNAVWSGIAAANDADAYNTTAAIDGSSEKSTVAAVLMNILIPCSCAGSYYVGTHGNRHLGVFLGALLTMITGGFVAAG